jgi:hypothetical protein
VRSFGVWCLKKLIGGFRDCACGCGGILPRAIRTSAPVGKEIQYIQRHHMKGKNLAEKNGMWKGDNPIHTSSLHEWLRRRLHSDLCQKCNKAPAQDLANITGLYNRELKNWKHLCKKCHVKMDYDNGVRKHWTWKNKI